jgi:chorismate dehydratase
MDRRLYPFFQEPEMTPLRIGVISFVNTLPLIRGLANELSNDYELVYASPSKLADQLRHGQIDVALIPAVEYLRGVGDGFVPGLCISSRGPVESIRLLSRKPLSELGTVLVDEGSRSSIAMLRILLDRVHRISPDFHIYKPDPAHPLRGPDGEDGEAALIIGDLAMEIAPDAAPIVIDLGEWWQNIFHQPFVYALWVYSHRSPGDEMVGLLATLLEDSFETGLAELTQICNEAGADKSWAPARVLDYLTNKIHYRLDEQAIAGLQTFRRLCVENYLAPERLEVAKALKAIEAESRQLSRSAT